MRKKIDTIVKGFLAMLMALMLLNVVWQVFTRYVLQSPSNFTDELSRYLLIWLSLLGASYASGRKMHLSIDLLPDRLSLKKQRLLFTFIHLLVLGFVLAIMLIGGGRLLQISYLLNQTSPALQIPLTCVYAIIPVSGLLITYYKLSDIINLYKPEAGEN